MIFGDLDLAFQMNSIGAWGRQKVNTTMRIIKLNKNKCREKLRVDIKVDNNGMYEEFTSCYHLHTCKYRQLYRLLDSANLFTLSAVYNYGYQPDSSVRLTSHSKDEVLLLKRK